MNSFTINAKLPSLNEYVHKINHNRFTGNEFKKQLEAMISMDIDRALKSGTFSPITEPCDIYVEFYEATMKRDVDNIQSSCKYILDTMQKMNVLPNDNRKWVSQIYHKVFESDRDYAVVYIYPANSIKLDMTGGE